MNSFTPARFSKTPVTAGESGSMTARTASRLVAHRCPAIRPRPLINSRWMPQCGVAPVIDSSDSLAPIETWFRQCELAAQRRFTATLADLKPVRPSDWFLKMLDRRILPALRGVGFERALAKSIMTLAAPAWESMGRLPANGSLLYPELTRRIEEIRDSTPSRSFQRPQDPGSRRPTRQAELISLAAINAEPARLFTLFESITTSWLVLPRTRRTLTRKDSRCLLIYLRHLDAAQNPAFRKALARVLIEYIGNFTLKYRHFSYPESSTQTALFFSYAALFWKNLRRPPLGREDDLICDHFFRWARRLRNNHRLPNPEMDAAFKQMSTARKALFPKPDAFGRLPENSRYRPQALVMALRSGEEGIASVLRCLGPSANLYKDTTACRISYCQVPAALQSLLRIIQRCWKTETPATRKNIRKCLFRLAASYRPVLQKALESDHPGSSSLRFAAVRAGRMIHSFSASIS